MDDERKKAKKRVRGLFLLCLGIALACFGFFACVVVTKRADGFADVSDTMVGLYKVIVLIGVFFLVLAFGYLLPAMLKQRKSERGEHDPSEMFDETNMRRALEKHIPDGETLVAGVHAVSRETCIKAVFWKCILEDDRLIPSENGRLLALSKSKYAAYDLYLGITQTSMIIVGCERNQYYYQFDNMPDGKEADVQEVTSDLLLQDIGTCFRLADVQSCEVKNGRMGSIKCFITMKNGSYFKLTIPKLGGLTGDMPHHAEYREAIIARLGTVNQSCKKIY